MRDVGNSTNANSVDLDIAPQPLRRGDCVDIEIAGSQVSCLCPPRCQFGYCSAEKTGIEVQSLILM